MRGRAGRQEQDRRRRLSASQLARLGYCETQFVLRERHGEGRPAPAVRAAQERGVREHARFEAAAGHHHNVAVEAQGSRHCFIATAVWGADDPRTQRLRAWRERRLRPHAWGRALVAAYYALSPALARACRRHPRLRRLLSRILSALLPRIGA